MFSTTGLKSLTTAAFVVVWYSSNILVIILNKYLLTNFGFRHPFLLTLLHMLSCTAFSWSLSRTGIFNVQQVQSRKQLLKISCLAVVFVSSILLGNISLRYIPVSFNQAIGATTPVWTAVAAFVLQGIREHNTTYAALIPVVGGIIIASHGEPALHVIGSLACVSACVGRALKSVIQSVLLSDPAEKMGSLSLLMYMAPIAALTLLPATIIMEPDSFRHMWELCAVNKNFLATLLLNCLFAYFVNLFNFLVTFCTSALTLQVLGNAKGAMAAFVSVLIFKNHVTYQGAVGFAIAVVGCYLYSEMKKSHASTATSYGLLAGRDPTKSDPRLPSGDTPLSMDDDDKPLRVSTGEVIEEEAPPHMITPGGTKLMARRSAGGTPGNFPKFLERLYMPSK